MQCLDCPGSWWCCSIQFDLVHVWITLFVFSVEGFINKLYPIFWFTYFICAKHKSNWKMIWNISFYYTRPGLNATYYSVWWPIAKKNEIKNENKKIEKIKNILFRKKTPQNYHGLWVPTLIIFLFKKKKQIIMAHECQIWYLKNFPLEITISTVVELIDEI